MIIEFVEILLYLGKIIKHLIQFFYFRSCKIENYLKISASIYSHPHSSAKEVAAELASFGVDYYHVDSFGDVAILEEITEIKKISDTPIDLHIVSKNPNLILDQLTDGSIQRVAIQIEELSEGFEFPKMTQTELGLAIHIDTDDLYDIIKHYRNQVDFILLMMTTPGVSGGQFQSTHFQKIRSIVQSFPDQSFTVDGGVNHEISYILRLLGIDTIVVGSYLTKQANMALALLEISMRRIRSAFHVVDYMIPVQHLHSISEDDSVLIMLKAMNQLKMGTVFVIDKEKRLKGIITNADIRKVLLNGDFDYSMNLDNFINLHPVTLSNVANTSDMISTIESTNFPIHVLPIIDEADHLCGAISFHKLLKED